MEQEPWNKINVPFPGAVSSVRVIFTSKTGVIAKNLLTENDKVLKVLRSTLLQTEVRVLYDLLYNLNNSARGNKTFRVLKQVEQCVNRLKEMKLDVALQSLTDLCPNMIQSELSVEAGEADLPSQAALEWQCLKVLGAAQLMSCALKRCRRAFVLSKQHMKHEFIVLNMVITSMLCRFWVIFRGILACLSTLYQHLLALRAEVALARPMPFLTNFTLPVDMADFLDPSDAALLAVKPKSGLRVMAHVAKEERQKAPVKGNRRGRMKSVKEDLGVAVQRELLLDASAVPAQTVRRSPAKKKQQSEKKRVFQRRTRLAATFKDMASCLDKMILWCASQKMNQTKRHLTFLRFKCRQMRGAEAAGYNVKKKLPRFKREARRAFCGVRGPGRKPRPSAACRFWSLRRRFFRSSQMRNNATRRVEPKTRVTSTPANDDWISRTIGGTRAVTIHGDSQDDIDDIFASVGL
ncbi:nucleolus and neural progenitor protein [Hippocampus zosterae]|uniref:nucleolus and neural progenitor protein n=1 Tax=Hippocampus zosterae TaxID=109293 RepID=UPI00223D45CD|nr:nucleolus and neural progenitor protein [Hippocampus zosterae]